MMTNFIRIYVIKFVINLRSMRRLFTFLITLLFVHRVTMWCEHARIVDAGAVTCVDYSPDGTMMLTTTPSRITIWERSTKQVLFVKTMSSSKFAKFSTDSPATYIAISSSNSDIQIISAVSPFGNIQTFNAGHGGALAAHIDFTSTNALVTCGGTNNKLRTWDLSTNPATLSLDTTSSQIFTCASLSATQIGTAASNNKLQLQTITSSTSISNVFSKTINACNQIAFSPTSAYMIAACNSGGANGVFLTISTTAVVNVVTTGAMHTVAYAKDGNTFCYGGDTKILYIVNGTSANNTIMSQFLQNSAILDSDFTNDGLYLAIGTQDGTIYEYAKYCLSCRPGYYTNLVAKTCVLCQTTMQGCAFCTSSTNCLQCYENYIIDTVNARCLSCAGLFQGCGTCFNQTACRYCIPGYYLNVNNTCDKCQGALKGCYTCNSTSYCFQCQSDYYLNTTTNTCIGCQLGLANCIKCTSNTTCTTCKMGFYISSGTCTTCPTNCYACQSATNCTDCVTGYYPFSSGGSVTCTRCSAGCMACNATGYCRNCADDRYLDGTGACVQCPYPCVSCNTSAYCLSCELAYYYNGSGGCTQCSAGCITCNSSGLCLSCSSGYYFDIPTSTCKQCQLFLPNCMQCTNTTCLKCQIGTYLLNSTTCTSCLSAMPACVACSSSTTCLFCAAGYYKTASSGTGSCQICTLGCATCVSATNCSSCNVGYYLNAGAATCNVCVNNCVSCSAAAVCLECQISYRLGTSGACVACITDIPNCQSCLTNHTTSTISCLSCQQNHYLTSTTLCSPCPKNCTTCLNSTFCTSCQIGMYKDINGTCTACHHNCSECTGAATNCSSCIGGYYLSAGVGSACVSCAVFGCASCNSTTHDCLSCQIGFYVKTVTGPPTKICDNCLTAIPNCYICTSATSCKQCSYGYALSPTLTTCSPCSTTQGCKHCTTLTSCQNCQIGYYLVITNSTTATCTKCSVGCKDCDQSGVCTVCFGEYYLRNVSGVVGCGLCQGGIVGCGVCSSGTVCTGCLSGYYLFNSTCHLCTQSIFSCKYCNSSTVCTSCQDGYYLSNNTCQKCQSTLPGCILCNSSSTCLSCEYGMYLNSTQCYKCTANLPNCIYCLNLTTCLQCDTGSYLSTTGCLNCQADIVGCIQCNSNTTCLQCKGGYFLNSSTYLCGGCGQEGCQVCVQADPLDCVKCNARFYYNTSLSTCIKCRTEIDGCLQCTNSTKCSKCDAGYYLNSTTFQCNLCQSNLQGCGRCNSALSCLQCKSTYYLNPTNNTCTECKLSLQGCSHCINGTICQSCYHGYYMNGTGICVACTQIGGCLSCLSGVYCQYCQNSYFLDKGDNLCYSCSVIQGCYACTNNLTCSICAGGYILNDEQTCSVMRVQAHESIKDLKLVTKYLNSTCLIHYLYAKDMNYNKSNSINWTKTTKLILQDSKYKQTQLDILKAQWGTNSYTLIFYTNNPLELGQNNFEFARRMLLSGSVAAKYKVNLKMDQATINQILPDFYLPKDLVMNYDISSPEFVMSYANAKDSLLYYSIFGYAVTLLLIVKYVLKAAWSVPDSPEMGELIPQVLALKAPAFMIYPTFLEFVYYCSGFMIPDFPWANQLFGSTLSDHSDTVVQSFALFYTNMSIGSTYLLALIIMVVIGFIMWLLYFGKDVEQRAKGFPMGNVMYNIFIFGATWAGCVSLQGALLNPIQTVNLNSGFYMLGIGLFCITFGISVYLVYRDRNNVDKLRIWIKASLLAAANISPIYIFSTSILIDLVILIAQYHLSAVKPYPKIWLLKNILCNFALCFLIFLPSIMISLIIASFLVVMAIFLDIFTHGKQYKDRIGKRKFKPDQESSVDVNIWNISYGNKDGKYALEEFNIQDQDNQKDKNDKDISDAARKTGFTNTNISFLPESKRQKVIKRKYKKPKESTQKPEIIDPNNPQQIQRNIFKQAEEENGDTFVAQHYLS